MNPEGNFEFSLAIPGYDHSEYVRFKIDVEDIGQCENDLKFQNARKPRAKELDSDSDFECKTQMATLAHRAPFRFLKQRKLIFEMYSKFQNQFNICGNIALI